MQRISSLAACRELAGLAACAAGRGAWNSGPSCCKHPALHRHRAGVSARPFATEPGRRLCRRRFVFAGDKQRPFSSQSGEDGPPGSSGRQPPVSVVGTPDPLTWIRCKCIMCLVQLYFELDMNSEEFEKGVKQALVYVSSKMSIGRYHELVGIVSNEMVEYVETKCKPMTRAQRKQLAVNMEDILFVHPEDISVVFDQYGRKFCSVAMRFWLLSSHEGPDDPEATKIFRVTADEDAGPKKKLATAVYEFHSELTRGVSPDWRVTIVWHWHWTLVQ
ncbi:uncharacterized protein C2orf47 homolog, mitochondrial [Stegastes partitus]|uniref:Uncharacterized protein C2orf47 homolog, mitochondrial-like n=1 Tax=Stegastes partitus TaxID=144197 RepID=A0A3B5AKM2_9TELE|nr:PREDICTED: uncharacterized protein C2orf47 homolog, mitochondrial-like [Stegastes partitus]